MTKDLLHLRDRVIKETRETYHKEGIHGPIQLFWNNFPPGHKWDLKSLPQFPGSDSNGREQYAMYKGQIVPASYIANNFYGQVSAGVGLSLPTARAAAEIGYSGHEALHLRNPFIHDQRQDEWAIISGYYDYWYNNPWMNGTHVPKGF